MATYPVALTFGSALPGQLTDPLEHLWLIRWSKACLLEGRSPSFCASVQYPTGVPLGFYPTMHLQTAAYLVMGVFTDQDVIRFNVLWFSGFVATGLGSFVLAWWTVGRVGPAWLAGLGAMLCGPMLMHAQGHLETMQVGGVPLFLIGWLRFIDRPGLFRLATAAGLYLLMVGCAPYFAVLAVFPAVWYVVWAFARTPWGTKWRWLTSRLGWLAGFGLLAIPGLLLLFSSQVWATAHGFAMVRTRSAFNQFGAPVWSTFLPSPRHLLGRATMPGLFEATGYASRMNECSSYLGLVTLGLLGYAVVRRVSFARSGYWWSVLGLMVVLSWGSHLSVGSRRVDLPAGWIYSVFPPFHLIRVPARFNLFAAVCAVVPASAALTDLMGRISRPGGKVALASLVLVVSLVDLSMVPFPTSIIPPLPAAYRAIMARNPGASLVDVPFYGANEGQVYSSLWEYWQAQHQGRTSAGYPGFPNIPFEAEVVGHSPFSTTRLLDSSEGVNAHDDSWLFLTYHKFDHAVLHRGPWSDVRFAHGLARLQANLAEAVSFEDGDAVVLDRDRLRLPRALTWLCGQGVWPALAKGEPWSFGVRSRSTIAVYDPSEGREVVVSLVDASAFRRSRVVRWVIADREVGRSSIEPSPVGTVHSPPIRLKSGLNEIHLIVDGDDRPSSYAERLDEAKTSYSLQIRAVKVRYRNGTEVAR